MPEVDHLAKASDKPNQKEQLLLLFAARVLNQARVVIDTWQRLNDVPEWQPALFSSFAASTDELLKFSIRFDKKSYQSIAECLAEANKQVDLNKTKGPNKKLVTQYHDAIHELKQLITRKTDEANDESPVALKSPIFIAVTDKELAEDLNNQLSFFGFITEIFDNKNQFLTSMLKLNPCFIIMDVDFGGERHSGITLINTINESRDRFIPTVFYAVERNDLETRLAAARAGGENFYTYTIDPRHLIETIEYYTMDEANLPCRVLVVDDSESQAHYTTTVLKKAGMHVHMITDPMLIMTALEEFKPEIVIMDMYMPGCNGMELAKIIRQEDKYVSIPIIYLSSEEDIDKQLAALSEGGDDFLTKPTKPNRLVITVRNRVNRARDLLSYMVTDSLTGLFNHTHTLDKLATELIEARKYKAPLVFCMIDIDFFKRINDNYGHPVGDSVIKNLSLYLKQRLRKSDIIGRYGGEEFAVVLPNTSSDEAMVLMEDLRQQFSSYRQAFNENEIQVTFSCGIALYDKKHPASSEKELAEKADKALYDAKRRGRNRVSLYDNTMENNAGSDQAPRGELKPED